jgi:hypothetical protein
MATKKQLVAGASGVGAIIGAGIGDKVSPVTYQTTPDMSWGIHNLDGTVSHLPATVQALNETGNHTAMAIGAGIGAIAGGVALHRALGRQFRGR